MNAENARLFSHYRCICINSRIIGNSLNVFDRMICLLSSCIWILSISNGKNLLFYPFISENRLSISQSPIFQFSNSAFPIFLKYVFYFW